MNPAVGRAAKTQAMEKCMVMEKLSFMADAVTTPWYSRKHPKVVTRTTTTVSSLRRTAPAIRVTRLSMLTCALRASATPAPTKFAQMKR